MSVSYQGTMAPRNSSTSEYYAAITPSDATDLEWLTRGVYVGGEGDVVAVLPSGDTVTFVGVLAGSVLPIACKRVNSTDTTATNIVALY